MLAAGRSLAGGDGLRQPPRRARPLDARAAGRCDGQAHRTQKLVACAGGPRPTDIGAVIQPCRNASNNSASDRIELRAGLGGPISATTRSRSVTRTVSPPAASRIYSLNLFLSVLRPPERIIQCSSQRLPCQMV